MAAAMHRCGFAKFDGLLDAALARAGVSSLGYDLVRRDWRPDEYTTMRAMGRPLLTTTRLGTISQRLRASLKLSLLLTSP